MIRSRYNRLGRLGDRTRNRVIPSRRLASTRSVGLQRSLNRTPLARPRRVLNREPIRRERVLNREPINRTPTPRRVLNREPIRRERVLNREPIRRTILSAQNSILSRERALDARRERLNISRFRNDRLVTRDLENKVRLLESKLESKSKIDRWRRDKEKFSKLGIDYRKKDKIEPIAKYMREKGVPLHDSLKASDKLLDEVDKEINEYVKVPIQNTEAGYNRRNSRIGISARTSAYQSDSEEGILNAIRTQMGVGENED